MPRTYRGGIGQHCAKSRTNLNSRDIEPICAHIAPQSVPNGAGPNLLAPTLERPGPMWDAIAATVIKVGVEPWRCLHIQQYSLARAS